MALKKYWWHKTDEKFNQWVKGSAPDEVDQRYQIVRSAYFFFRENLRERIKRLSNISFQFPIPVEVVQEDVLEDTTIPEMEEPDFDSGIRFKSQSTREANNKIINGILSGDQFVFNEFYENEFPKIAKLVIQNTGSIENARDIFQDGMIILLEKVYRKEFNHNCSLGTYLYSICRLLWFSELRKKKVAINLVDQLSHFQQDISVVEVEHQPDVYEVVKAAIESLGDPCKQLLERYYFQNQTCQEIADALGYASAASAKNQKYKCLERIRRKVNVENE